MGLRQVLDGAELHLSYPVAVSGRMVVALLALSLVAAQPALGGTGMFVGAADDGARSLDPLRAKAKMDRAALAGFGVLRMTVIWSPGPERLSSEHGQAGHFAL